MPSNFFKSAVVLVSLYGCAAFASNMQKVPDDLRSEKTPYIERESVKTFARDLSISSSIDENYILRTLAQAVYQSSAAKAIVPPSAPGQKNWRRYRSRFVEPYRIKKGLQFWDTHEASLKKTEALSGVPQSVIVAIIGVETIYGEHTGTYRAIDALATLAFDYPPSKRDRSAFFKQELAALFQLSKESNLDPLTIKGSYAGAIGLGQFMPSSWRNFAIDGSGDGRIDLFQNPDDAIASVGNFLAKHGWVRGGLRVANASVNDALAAQALIEADILPKFTATELAKYGVTTSDVVTPTEKFALIDLPNGLESVEYRLGPHNFYVVSRYNRSSFYALSVIELANALEAARMFR